MDGNLRNQGLGHKKILSLFIILLILIALPVTIFIVSQNQLQDSRGRASFGSDVQSLTQELISSNAPNPEKISISVQRKEQTPAPGRVRQY